MAALISERVIEDILSADRSILAEILGLNPHNLSLIARQKIVDSGILDLLYLYEQELLLIELKAVDFYEGILTQIDNYHADLLTLQSSYKLINANIRKIILVTGCTLEDIQKCSEASIQLLTYQPQVVLSKYYENFKELSYFLKIQSGD
jgi:hypothetical protein